MKQREAGINAGAGAGVGGCNQAEEQRILPKLTSRRLLPERRRSRGRGEGSDGDGGLRCVIEQVRDVRF